MTLVLTPETPTTVLLTNKLMLQSAEMRHALHTQFDAALNKQRFPDEWNHQIGEVRCIHGFRPIAADMLTPPKSNKKLAKGAVAQYGLTLAHANISGYELCPWRTPTCTKGCVLLNGNGAYPSVQRAWLWRTTLLADHPQIAAGRIGWELGRAVRKHGHVHFRPDVNSDLAWHRFLPELATLDNVDPYGYSKNKAILSPTFDPRGFAYAYSWNETSKLGKVRDHLLRGGKVAAVTSRKRDQPVDVAGMQRFFGVEVPVVDADKTDAWILDSGPAIGDLTAKGKMRSDIGRSTMIIDIY